MAQFLDTAWITKKIERKTVNAFYQKQNVKPENYEEHHRISRFKRFIEKVSISTRGLKCSSSLQHIGNSVRVHFRLI